MKRKNFESILAFFVGALITTVSLYWFINGGIGIIFFGQEVSALDILTSVGIDGDRLNLLLLPFVFLVAPYLIIEGGRTFRELFEDR